MMQLVDPRHFNVFINRFIGIRQHLKHVGRLSLTDGCTQLVSMQVTSQLLVIQTILINRRAFGNVQGVIGALHHYLLSNKTCLNQRPYVHPTHADVIAARLTKKNKVTITIHRSTNGNKHVVGIINVKYKHLRVQQLEVAKCANGVAIVGIKTHQLIAADHVGPLKHELTTRHCNRMGKHIWSNAMQKHSAITPRHVVNVAGSGKEILGDAGGVVVIEVVPRDTVGGAVAIGVGPSGTSVGAVGIRDAPSGGGVAIGVAPPVFVGSSTDMLPAVSIPDDPNPLLVFANAASNDAAP
eukprot:356500-Chlamydomonas_euryale.AAC.1